MTEIDVGEAVGAGFRLIRRRPLDVVIWGLVIGGFALAALAVMGPAFVSIISLLREQGHPDPQALMPALIRLQAGSFMLNVVQFAVRAMVIAAIFRAVLQPEKGAFAYLRLGMTELYLAVLIFGLAIAFGIGVGIAVIPIMIIIATLSLAHAIGAAIAVGFVAVVFVLGALLWVSLRLSLLGPMIVAQRNLPFDEAWALTQGRTGSLFTIGLCLVAIVLGLEVLVFGVGAMIALGFVGTLPTPQEGFQSLVSRPWKDIVAGLAPVLLLAWLILSLIAGCVMAIFVAPWADVYRQLKGPDAAAAPTAETAPAPA